MSFEDRKQEIRNKFKELYDEYYNICREELEKELAEHGFEIGGDCICKIHWGAKDQDIRCGIEASTGSSFHSVYDDMWACVRPYKSDGTLSNRLFNVFNIGKQLRRVEQ